MTRQTRNVAGRTARWSVVLATVTGFSFAAAAQDITVTSYGGIWEEAINECYAKEFNKRTGYKANVLIGSPAQWLSQVEANPDDPPINVIVSTQPNVLAAAEKGLYEPMTEENVPNLKDVPQFFKDAVEGHGACFDYGAFIIAYNKDTVKNPPKTTKELVERTLKGEWVLTMPSISYAISPTVLVWGFADLYGGDVNNVDPAFDVFKQLKGSGNMIAWSSVTDFLNQMSTGEADIGMYWDGRAWAFIDKGNDWLGVVAPEDEAVMTCVAMNAVKNSPPSVWEYLNIVFEPGPMSCFSDYLQYGVTNKLVTYSDKLKNRITPWDATRTGPAREIGKNTAAWIERWNKEIGH